MRRAWQVGFSLLVPLLAAGCAPAPRIVEAELAGRVLAEVNDARAQAGLKPLLPSVKLHETARRHTLDMARHEKLDHRGSDGTLVEQRLAKGKVDWAEAAENVARNRGYEDPAGEAVRAWLASPEHRKNILHPGFCETGVAVIRSPAGAFFITQVFLTPMP